MQLRKILVPVDFSDCSVAAVRRAFFLAERLGAALTVLHVYEVPEVLAASRAGAVGAAAAVLHELEVGFAHAGEGRIRELLARHQREPGVPVAVQVVRGTPWVQIVRLADEGAFDLIVMGTHGRSELAQLWHGSVAANVGRRASCPVMTVRGGARE
jgi:nucleotide-binding universal stress UspA family protein